MSITRIALAVAVALAATLAAPAAETEGKDSEKSFPKEASVDLGGGIKMDFVLIRPGTFTMGAEKSSYDDERPTHKVTIAKAFYMGKYEVTQEQWQQVMGSNPSKFKGAKNPVEEVSWDDCQTFARKVTEKLPGQTVRLPTEAEWEYACRAGSATDFYYGDDEAVLGEYAWYIGNASLSEVKPGEATTSKTHPVGEKKPNAWGLYDMHGNVWEWCLDWYGKYDLTDATDPVGPSSGPGRVLRGGACHYGAASVCRSAYRYNNLPSNIFNYYGGVRVVLLAR